MSSHVTGHTQSRVGPGQLGPHPACEPEHGCCAGQPSLLGPLELRLCHRQRVLTLTNPEV